MPKPNVYVDGFNLYYGCVKGSPFKWLDLAQLSAKLLPAAHQIYLRALATIPNLTISYGHFLNSTVRMPLAPPARACGQALRRLRT